ILARTTQRPCPGRLPDIQCAESCQTYLSFACRVYDANVRRIIDSFSLGPKLLSSVSCATQISRLCHDIYSIVTMTSPNPVRREILAVNSEDLAGRQGFSGYNQGRIR